MAKGKGNGRVSVATVIKSILSGDILILMRVDRLLPYILFLFALGWVNIFLNLMVAIIAFLLGGQIGVGTLIALFGTGMVMDLIFKIVRFEPRDVEHEGLTGTLSALAEAWKSSRTPAN